LTVVRFTFDTVCMVLAQIYASTRQPLDASATIHA
jgi:hypothetical protein